MNALGERLLAFLVRGVFLLMRLLGPRLAPALGGFVARNLGPYVGRAHRIALQNLRLAFPEKDEAWRAGIARQAWDNLGRTTGEYVHLARIFEGAWPPSPGARVELSPAGLALLHRLAAEHKPVLVFAAHLANWELPAVAAHAVGQNAAILYRTPNNPYIAEMIRRMREPIMGRLIPAQLSAPIRLAEAYEEGLNLGMLVDQRFGRGPMVPFFGHDVAANPLIPRLAARYDAPLYGMRAVRLPQGRFRLELEGPFELPRDARGKVDVPATTAMMNRVIEGWVRENPGQWLWMHRRWR